MSVKCLPCKHEDPSLHPQQPHQKQASGCMLATPAPERQRQGDLWNLMPSDLGEWVSCRLSERLIKKVKWRVAERQIPDINF